MPVVRVGFGFLLAAENRSRTSRAGRGIRGSTVQKHVQIPERKCDSVAAR